jgi:sigma-B regulation protein RsbU (phosphoserine phosphatase)
MSDHRTKGFRPTLAFKLGLLVLASTGLVFFVAFAYNNQVARRLMVKNVEEATQRLAQSTVARITSLLQSVERTPMFVAQQLSRPAADTNYIVQSLQDILTANPHIYSASIAFEPGMFSPQHSSFAPLVYRQQNQWQYRNLAQGIYNYAVQDWYLIPKQLNRPIWSEPYYDEGGANEMMCAFSVPFYRTWDNRPEFAGVVSIALQLEHIIEQVSTLSLYRSGYVYLISQNGQLISHPNLSWVFRESIFSVAEQDTNAQLRQIGLAMVRGQEGLERFQSIFTRRMSWMYYAPVSSVGWSVGIVFPEEEILADLSALNRDVLWIGTIGFALLFCVVVLLSRGVTRPISSLARQTHEIARGNLDVPLPIIRSHDEVEALSRSFENMRVALKEYIANLADTTAAKERIESELKIARNIQRSFLPKQFPPFPDKSGFDLFADLQPAKEVGGDLYDFFLLDEHRLFFSIGDVSDKGVPAALLMAVTKTLMKGVAEQDLSPSAVLTKVNAELALDNETMMFVTLFCGILDFRTGELVYSNAGHLPPLLIRNRRDVSWLDLPKGLVLGAMEDSCYETLATRLQPGDSLVLYTDGVTEAMNAKQNLYGEDQLFSLIELRSDDSPRLLVENIFRSVHEYAEGTPQSDDITVLVLHFSPECAPK